MKKPQPQKPPEETSGGNDWMNTYCDMVTLLFAFFVLLFAISNVDAQKFNMLAASLSNRGASPEDIMELAQSREIDPDLDFENPLIPIALEDDTNPLQQAFDSIIREIENNDMGDLISANLGDDFIFIRFVDEMLFGPNSAVIQQSDIAILNFIGQSLRLVQDDVGMIRIDGHTATIPVQGGYIISDRDLSSERANAVLKYFEDVVGIRSDKLAALAFGRNRPIASNDNEEGRRQNRRIEIMITRSDNITLELDLIYERMAIS